MFATSIKQFSNNLEALRGFVELVAPFLSKKSQEKIKSQATNLAPLMLLFNRMEPDTHHLTETDEKMLKEKYGIVGIEIQEDGSGHKSASIQMDSKRGEVFEHSLDTISRQFRQESLLYQSSLISLVSAAEWFLSQILHAYFEKYPDPAGLDEKQLSYADLKTLGSIEDAKSHIIDSKIEGVLRGGFDNWLAFLKKPLNLSMSYIKPHESRLAEVCLRRNLLVHNGGIVNTIYLSKVPADVKEGVKAGDLIDVSSTYLEDAISRCEQCFILIAAELWKNIEPHDEDRSSTLIDIAYDHLCAERWEIAASISYFIMNDKQIPEMDRMKGTLNYWQALKWQGRFEEIKKEVENADFSAKDEVLTLGKLALLDDEAEFFKLLPKCIKSGKLIREQFEEWPIFREMRVTETCKTKYGKRRKKRRSARKDVLPQQSDDTVSPQAIPK